jgi:glucose/arabinose dehydrogenase
LHRVLKGHVPWIARRPTEVGSGTYALVVVASPFRRASDAVTLVTVLLAVVLCGVGAPRSQAASSATTVPTARNATTTTTPQAIDGIPQGAGRLAPADDSGQLPTTGTTLPPGPVKVRLVAAGVATQPVAVVSRTGDEALYVVEKQGRIRALRGGAADPAAVLDISANVASTNENGLLGLAFGPDGNTLYVFYNDKRRAIVVSEFPFDGRVADQTKERRLIVLPKTTDEHNAGTLVTTEDGLLWIAIGDGGPAGDPSNNAQRLDRLFGKVLRIDPRTPGEKLPYSIPPDNPFVPKKSLDPTAATSRRTEIWAYGLRNPWRLSIDRATGDVWIPDVGEGTTEEINRVPFAKAGINLGWRAREGRRPYKGGRPATAVDPIYDYPHRDGRCAVVGGFVYRGLAIPALQGAYVFADVCNGQISALVGSGATWKAVSLGARLSYITSFGQDSNGELLATSLEGGIVRITA